MSNNPFMDYQEQFFKLWNDNMDQMLNSDAYKAIAKNIPGAETYTKAMEAMVPNVENYWKTMASSMPAVTAMNPVMDYWKDFADKMPGMDYFKNMPTAAQMMDYWKNFADAAKMMDYWKQFADADKMMEYWKNFADVDKMMETWKEFAEKNPFMEYWKGFTENMPNMGEYWQNFQKMLPNMSEYWKSFPTMFPGMNNYWDSFAKMMPNPEKFAELAPFKVPGFEAFTKVFDMWKSFGDPTAMVQDFQQKFNDVMADILKGLFPENVQAFLAKPTDFMNMMVEYYKQFVSPWVEIDADIMERLAKGDPDAYIDFFKQYQDKYAESVEKYFTIYGMGLNREANEDYMKAMNTWNKAMISMGELMAVINKTGQESFEKIAGYAAIYTSLFVIIREFVSEKNKTMKNKVAVGNSRFGIYVSKFIFSLAVYIFTYVIHALATAAVIMSRKEEILVKAVYLQDAVFSLAVIGLLTVSVIVLIIGIFYWIGPYACVAIALGFIVAAMGLSNIATTKLDEPQYIETYNEEGVVLSREDNPAYVSGIERSIYKGIIDYNPVTAFSSERDERSGEYPDDYINTSNVQIRSAILWFVIYNGISIVCFRKMERL